MATADPLEQLNGYYTQGSLAGRLVSSVKPEELAAIKTPNPTQTPTPSPTIQRTIDTTGADAAQNFLDTSFKQPETQDQIAERKRQQAAGLIDSIESTYQDEKARLDKTGQDRLAQDNAASVLSGLMGSNVANNTHNKVLDLNDKEQQALAHQKMLDLQSIYMDIDKSAQEEARQQMEDATKNAEDVVARRSAAQSKAVDQLKTLASGGLVDYESFKSNPQNSKVYQYALDSVGGSDDTLRAMFLLNRPQDQIVGTPQRIGNKYVQAYQNPITGKVKYESLDLPDLPDNYSTFQKIGSDKVGEKLIAIPDNWDGDMSKVKVVASTKPVPSTQSGYTVDENGNVVETGNYDSLTIGRYNKAANAATAILQKNPTFKNIIGASAYLDRVEAAVKNPGSVGDQELLDAFTQLNTGGNRVTEAQVHLITGNQSLGDALNKWSNKLSTGGSLSADQRKEIVSLANEVYKNYQNSYQPLYDDATKRLQAQGIPKQFWNIPDPKTLSRSVSDGSGTQTADQNTPTTTKSGKAFDYAGAKAAGYSDDEIQAYIDAN